MTAYWHWTVFDYHDLHPASHEALAVVAGSAESVLAAGPVFCSRSARATR